MIRYAAWHVTEPGFKTPEGAKRFIQRQAFPKDWVVVATTDDFIPDPSIEKIEEDRIKDEAVEEERKRIRSILGI